MISEVVRVIKHIGWEMVGLRSIPKECNLFSDVKKKNYIGIG